jgi:hypothetical protein
LSSVSTLIKDHFMVTEGGTDEAGGFHLIPRMDDSRLAEIFAREVLMSLVGKELISPEWGERILSWRHSGFSVTNCSFWWSMIRSAASKSGIKEITFYEGEPDRHIQKKQPILCFEEIRETGQIRFEVHRAIEV